MQTRDPERDRTTPACATAAGEWRSRRADPYEAFIRDRLGDDETLVAGIADRIRSQR
ncbi:hypothetical protein [Streptosporangium lutulentum]|uniref:Uncharacterized protein n=1 Tax=Streptosporangium lutulentum TaxID=1461250 RepID=A0ABT9Q8K8_9ACTN|nr:hypothetical protein [Streptosporangium lutulentum]MDP9843085.1 hypothetical protein [Streptosporangium lutulentum]